MGCAVNCAKVDELAGDYAANRLIWIVLGLATRMATLPFLGMLVVIQTFVYPQAWVEHLTWVSILLFLLTRGPGAISLDHLIWRRWHATASSHS